MKRFLVLLETYGQAVSTASAAAVDFARQTGRPFDILIAGGPTIEGVDHWKGCGAESVIVAMSESLTHPTADRLAAYCVLRLNADTSLIGPSTIDDVLARVAGIIDAPFLGDVDRVEFPIIGAEGPTTGLAFRKRDFDGRVETRVRVDMPCAVFSVRPRKVDNTQPAGGPIAQLMMVSVDESTLPQSTTWVSRTSAVHKRPPLEEARVIVAGGRSLGDASSFEQYLGKIADKLGGAVAASGGAVHSGIAPSTQLIGQTGLTVAPDLYIAVGISGADQHVGGMQKSRVIVAVNRDPHAAIFRIADYGLVADFREALPELAEKL